MRAALWAALVAGAAAQAREPTQYDNITEACSTASPTGATISSVTQTGVDEVTVAYTGYGANGPEMLWLTNQDGTIISYRDSGTAGNALAGASNVMTFQAASLAGTPTEVRAHTCPPSTTFTTPKRMWRGIYEDATNNCCSDQPISAQDRTDYAPTITIGTGNGAGSWNAQQFSFAASKKSALMYAQDDGGRIVYLEEVAAPVTGAYNKNNINLPSMAKSIRACSIQTLGDVANQKNPICTEKSLLTDIVTNLEAEAGNPALQSWNWFLNLSYTGSEASPIAVWDRDTVPDVGTTCISYARDGSPSGTILTMSSGALEVKFNDAIESAKTGNKLYLYSCCNVVYDTSRGAGFSGGRTVPYTCPNTELYSLAVDVVTGKAAAVAAIKAAAQTAGVGSLSTGQGERCEDGVSTLGMWRVNKSDTGMLNCTCTLKAGEVFAKFECVQLYGAKSAMWRDGTIIAVVMVGVISLLILLVALSYVFMQKQKAPRPSQFGSVKFDGNAAGGSTDTYM